MEPMAVAPKRPRLKRLSVGDLVEIDGRKYDVVRDRAGGVMLEPAITKTVDELYGGRPLSSHEFDELFGDLPSDGEG